MSDSRLSTSDEKGTIVEEKPKAGFFARRKAAKADEEKEPQDEALEDKKEPQVSPVSFTALFRYVITL